MLIDAVTATAAKLYHSADRLSTAFFVFEKFLFQKAEKEGFEPSRRYQRPTPFPGEPLRPAWVLLQKARLINKYVYSIPSVRNMISRIQLVDTTMHQSVCQVFF